jgi:hypothetical protein
MQVKKNLDRKVMFFLPDLHVHLTVQSGKDPIRNRKTSESFASKRRFLSNAA